MLSKGICALLIGCLVLSANARNLKGLGLSDELLHLQAKLDKGLGHDKSAANSTLHDVLAALSTVPDFAQFMGLVKQLQDATNNVKTKQAELDPDVYRTICEVVVDKGFSCEEHTVQTQDGFLLKIFRVFKSSSSGKRPVLLSHGLLDTAFSWILSSPSSSLGFLLADAGFDVWLGNVRGNIYGTDHTRWGEFDRQLWDFSFDEQGEYDVPDTVNYILNRSSEQKIAIVGHSQGCAQTFSAVQQLPSLADKISIFIALAPAGYFEYLTNRIISLAAGFYLADLLELLGVDKFLYLPDGIEDLIPVVCDAFPNLVESLLALVMGSNPGEIDLDRLEVACAQSIGWTSMHNMVHWSQLVRDEKFQFFDYGFLGNRDTYGSGTPPLYSIASTWPSYIPVAVFYGGNDDLAPVGDVEQIIKLIPARALIFQKKIDAYAHLDFTWGKTAATQVYNQTIALIKQYHF